MGQGGIGGEAQAWSLEIKDCSIMEDAPGQLLRGMEDVGLSQLAGFPFLDAAGNGGSVIGQSPLIS